MTSTIRRPHWQPHKPSGHGAGARKKIGCETDDPRCLHALLCCLAFLSFAPRCSLLSSFQSSRSVCSLGVCRVVASCFVAVDTTVNFTRPALRLRLGHQVTESAVSSRRIRTWPACRLIVMGCASSTDVARPPVSAAKASAPMPTHVAAGSDERSDDGDTDPPAAKPIDAVQAVVATADGDSTAAAAATSPSLVDRAALALGGILVLSKAAEMCPFAGAPLVAAALRLCYEIFNSANAKPQWMAEFMVRATATCCTQRTAISRCSAMRLTVLRPLSHPALPIVPA